MAGTFELFVDAESKFRFRLKAPDGTVMAVSAAFRDKSAAVAGIAAVRECAGMGLISDLCSEAGAQGRVQESAPGVGAPQARHDWPKRADAFHTRAKTIRRAASSPRWTGAA
ncbi:DUF1508 domain-containing protein [Arthrobacter sp. AL12]|uniref:YegP family protein n=1 Tax=Arthrobacter sp. AL12 TaxID=3042241 RepID=UPI00249BFA12|nr:DUF1508 domain-containing protein [Arthrobacter sp. AL12]MDI3211036.1 DUF1508 domain-containing protein [Arthrobacter sp. AL12]